MRTLVVHTGGIGDFLLCCPALIRLRVEGPVDLAGSVGRLRLATANGWADAAYSLHATGFDSLFSEPSEQWRTFASAYDRAVIWMRDEDGSIARGCAFAGIGRVHIHAGLPPTGWQHHASQYYLQCLGLPDTPPPRMRRSAEAPPRSLILHPGSGGARKNWPMQNFIALDAALQSDGWAVQWLAGPAEEELPYPSHVKVVHDLSLEAVADRLTRTAHYLGNDSGITHLAAAAGCRVTAIFGPTDPIVWAPQGANVSVVAGDPWPDVARVYQAVRLT